MADDAPEPVTAAEGLPSWVTLAWAIALPLAIVLPTPFQLMALVILWAWFLFCVINEPERAIFLFLITMALIKVLAFRSVPLLRGMNSDTIFIVLLAFCAFTSQRRQPQPVVRNPYVAPMTYFSLMLLASALISYGTGSAQYHFRETGWVPRPAGDLFSNLKSDLFYLFLAPIAFRLIWSRAQLRTAVTVTSVYAGVVAFEALIHRSYTTVILDEVAPTFLRAAGKMFREPNNLGGFLALTLVLVTPVLLKGKLPLLERLVVAGCSAVMVVGLVYSYSRGAWIAALGGFFLLGVLRGAKGVVGLLLLALVGTIWMPQTIKDRYEHTVRESEVTTLDQQDTFDNSTESRIARWAAVPGMYSSSPLYGHGYRSFGRVYGSLNGSGRDTGPHSTVIQLLVEEGALGMIGYYWLLGVVGWTAFRLRGATEDPLVESVATGVVAAVPTLMLLDLAGPLLFADGAMAAAWPLLAGATRQYSNLVVERHSSSKATSATALHPRLRTRPTAT